MQDGTRHLKVDPLLGVDESYQATPTAAESITNMSWDPRGAWRESGGLTTLLPKDDTGSTKFTGHGLLKSMHWWAQGGRQHLMFELYTSSNQLDLCVFNGSGGSAGGFDVVSSDRQWVRGPWAGTQYLAVGNWCYFVNGLDQPQRWDGRTVRKVGFDVQPGAPAVARTDRRDQMVAGFNTSAPDFNATHARGVGTLGDKSGWTYGYAVTWVNDLGMESPPSPISYVTYENPDNARRYVKVHVPDAPEHVRGQRLYRTVNLYATSTVQSANLYLVDSWGSRKGLVYMDGTHDAELGAQLDTSQLGLFPRNAQLMAYFKGTMFVVSADTAARINYSAPLMHEQMPPSNYMSVGDYDGGAVTGMYPTKNALVVFKERGVYLIKGDPSSGFYSETLTEDIGAASANALVEVPGQGLLFVSHAGIYLLKGALENTGTPTTIAWIGKGLQKTWEQRVNRGGLASAWAEAYHRDREVWVHVPEYGDARPTLGLVYHYDIGQWSIRPDWPMSCATTTRDHRQHLILGSHASGLPGVWVYTRGAADQDGTPLTVRYQSAWSDFGSVWQRTQLLHVQPYVQGIGSNLTLRYNTERSQSFTTPLDSVKAMETTEGPSLPKWGTATWTASERWQEYPTCVMTWTVGEMSQQVQWQLTSEGRIRLISLNLVVLTTGDPLNVQPLDATLSTRSP